jgi:hypothetical protein
MREQRSAAAVVEGGEPVPQRRCQSMMRVQYTLVADAFA